MTDHEKDIENLKLQIDILKKDIEFLENESGLYQLTIDSLKKQLAKAIAERDSVRMECCQWIAVNAGKSPTDENSSRIARDRGWDCYKENTNDR